MIEDSPLAGVSPLLKVLGRSFEEGDATKYSRSDVLRPLWPPMGGLATLIAVLIYAKAPVWLLLSAIGGLGAVLLVYVSLYLYCFAKRPDSLRSERFELTKYALEHHLFGDNTTGLIEGAPLRSVLDGQAGGLSDASGGSA